MDPDWKGTKEREVHRQGHEIKGGFPLVHVIAVMMVLVH